MAAVTKNHKNCCSCSTIKDRYFPPIWIKLFGMSSTTRNGCHGVTVKNTGLQLINVANKHEPPKWFISSWYFSLLVCCAHCVPSGLLMNVPWFRTSVHVYKQLAIIVLVTVYTVWSIQQGKILKCMVQIYFTSTHNALWNAYNSWRMNDDRKWF